MAGSVTPITIRGRYFWKGEERFLVKGVVYQQYGRNKGDDSSSIPDPLADDQLEDLKLSIPLFKELGLNTLFVYSIDGSKNHDTAMDLLAEAGIYVLACLSTPHHHIRRASPFASYTPDLLQHCFRAVDAMARYPNTLGLAVANEVINAEASTRAAPVIRALARDVRRYMRLVAAVADRDGGGDDQQQQQQQEQERILPLGVSAADVASVLMPQFAYLCGVGGEEEDDDGALDFFSFNCYSWCGNSSMLMSGYENHVRRFSHTPVPVFFSEYGANLISPRPFGEALALCSPAMTGVFSGGVVYEFFLGPNRYGLVQKKKKNRRSRDRDGMGPERNGKMKTKKKWTEEEEEEEEEGEVEGWGEQQEVYLSRTQDYKNLRTNLRAGERETLLTIPEFAGGGADDDNATIMTSSSSSPTVLKRPDMPGPGTAFWQVDRPVPECPLDWEAVKSQIEDRQWVDVEREIERLGVEDLAATIWERFRIDGTGPQWG